MKCPMETPDTAALLLAYSSRKLDSETTVQLDAHLETCAACREFVDAQAAVWEALDSWEPAPISADFDRRLYQRIESRVSWWDALMRPLRPFAVRHAVPVAAVFGVLLTASYLLDRPVAVPVSISPVRESAQLESLQPEQVEHALDELETISEFSHRVRSDASSESKL